jgi:AcrR family transcriptional regulator
MKDTDDRILAAARRIFTRDGYVGATTRSIAKEARVNEVTLFRKFGTKENIMRAVVDWTLDSGLQSIDSLFSPEADTHEKLSRSLSELGRRIDRTMRQRRSTDAMILLYTEGRRAPGHVKLMSQIWEHVDLRLQEYFEKQISLGKMRPVNPKIAALVYHSFIFYNNLARGIVNPHILAKDNEFDEFVDIFVSGIGYRK